MQNIAISQEYAQKLDEYLNGTGITRKEFVELSVEDVYKRQLYFITFIIHAKPSSPLHTINKYVLREDYNII